MEVERVNTRDFMRIQETVVQGDEEDRLLAPDGAASLRFVHCVLRHSVAAGPFLGTRKSLLKVHPDVEKLILARYGASLRTLLGLRRFFDPMQLDSAGDAESFDDVVLCYVHWHRSFRMEGWSLAEYQLTPSAFQTWKGQLMRFTLKRLRRPKLSHRFILESPLTRAKRSGRLSDTLSTQQGPYYVARWRGQGWHEGSEVEVFFCRRGVFPGFILGFSMAKSPRRRGVRAIPRKGTGGKAGGWKIAGAAPVIPPPPYSVQMLQTALSDFKVLSMPHRARDTYSTARLEAEWSLCVFLVNRRILEENGQECAWVTPTRPLLTEMDVWREGSTDQEHFKWSQADDDEWGPCGAVRGARLVGKASRFEEITTTATKAVHREVGKEGLGGNDDRGLPRTLGRMIARYRPY